MSITRPRMRPTAPPGAPHVSHPFPLRTCAKRTEGDMPASILKYRPVSQNNAGSNSGCRCCESGEPWRRNKTLMDPGGSSRLLTSASPKRTSIM